MQEDGWVSFESHKLKMGGGNRFPQRTGADTRRGKMDTGLTSKTAIHSGKCWTCRGLRQGGKGGWCAKRNYQWKCSEKKNERRAWGSFCTWLRANAGKNALRSETECREFSADILFLGNIWGGGDGVLTLWLNLLWDLTIIIILPIFSRFWENSWNLIDG